MHAQILRKSNGHFTLLFPLVTGDGGGLPVDWTHIELDLDGLRILCALPEHPRPETFELRDPRLSSWLRARVHSGKLKPADAMEVSDLFEGVYHIEKCKAVLTEATVPALSEETMQPLSLILTPQKTSSLRSAAPRTVRRVAQRASVAVRAS